MSTPKTVVVTGSTFNGTTMFAGVLQILGVSMLKTPTHPNVWEDKEIYRVLSDEELITNYVNLRNEEHDVWGFKHPDISGYLERLNRLLRNPHFFMIVRDPAAVFYRENNQGSDLTLENVNTAITSQKKTLDVLISMNNPNTSIFSYEKALIQPKRFIDKVINLLQIDPDGESVDEAVEFIQPERRHPNLIKYFKKNGVEI